MKEQETLKGSEPAPPAPHSPPADAQAPLFFRAEFVERFLAKFIDFLIMFAFFIFPSFVGPLAGATYILISDGLAGGASLGKRVIGLRVVRAQDHSFACDFKTSIMRNLEFGALIAFYYIVGWIPYLGKFLAFVACVAVVGAEMLLIYTDELGERFGDRFAGTLVVPSDVSLE